MNTLIEQTTVQTIDTSRMQNIIDEVLQTHAHVVAEYHGGKITTI